MTAGRGQSDNSSATSRRNSGCLTVLSLFLINSLRLQESHFSRELCSKIMTSGRSMSWILCGDSRLNPQIPLPLRPITTFFGMQLTNMIFTTPRRDLRERHSYPNMRKSMMKMDISMKKNNFSMTLSQKKNFLYIQFINHHFIIRCHRNLTFLPKSGKHFLKAPNKWSLSTTRKSSSTTLHHTLVGARLNLTLHWVSPILPHNKFISIHKMMLKRNHLLTLLPILWLTSV